VQKNMDYIETPEPVVGRSKLATVSFQDDEPSSQATATATLNDAKPTSAIQWKQVEDILKWRNPAASALTLLLGSFAALAVEVVLRGDHNITPFKGEGLIALPAPSCQFCALCSTSYQAERR
jgi:hypothetical protein